jgi:site-specific recombinase XerD
MTTSPSLISPYVQAFFADHLQQHKRLSPQTIASCRDTFRLLLNFMKHTRGIEPSALRVTDLEAPTILTFLDYLEQQRGNRVRSRNIRLSALRTFFRFVALREPESVGMATRVLAIPRKREDKKLIGYLTREEIEALLAAPDRSQWIGRRDHSLLLTMYNSGARVSEIVTLTRPQVHFGATTFLQLHGKGRKERTVPLWPDTARVLKTWFQEVEAFGVPMAFPNARGNPLSRYGAKYVLQRAVQRAVAVCPSLSTKTITPHVVRHSTAMHLLQSGVDIAVIALWLGHESIETTHVYLEADLATKEQALKKLAVVEDQGARFTADDPLLAFLNAL